MARAPSRGFDIRLKADDVQIGEEWGAHWATRKHYIVDTFADPKTTKVQSDVVEISGMGRGGKGRVGAMMSQLLKEDDKWRGKYI